MRFEELAKPELQWGRSISAAEISRGLDELMNEAVASMGPQHLSCGNRVRTLAAYPHERHGLQWGRSISAAEIGR
jgi:hypothetical protein